MKKIASSHAIAVAGRRFLGTNTTASTRIVRSRTNAAIVIARERLAGTAGVYGPVPPSLRPQTWVRDGSRSIEHVSRTRALQQEKSGRFILPTGSGPAVVLVDVSGS